MMARRVLVIAAILAAMTSLVPAAAPTAEASDCTDGVIVVVDASAFGAGISQRCVPGAPGTGLDALEAADHDYTFVPRFPGLVCTIDQRPDPCNGAPTDAYWSYWYAEQGGSWTYSTSGAGSRNPRPGTVEGWSFGSGSAPGIAPPGGDPEPDPEPEEQPEEEPSSGSGSGSSGSGSGGSSSGSGGSGSSDGSSGSGSSGSSGGSGASSSSGSGEGPSSSDSTSPSTSQAEGSDDVDGDEPTDDPSVEPAEPADEVPVDDTAGYRSPDEEPPAPPEEATSTEPTDEDDTAALPERDEDGVPVGLITGGGLIAGLAGLTAFQVRRRRLEA